MFLFSIWNEKKKYYMSMDMFIPMHNVYYIGKHEIVCPVLASLFHYGCHEKPCHPICVPTL